MTAIGLVVVMCTPRRARRRWEVSAVAFAVFMAVSRVYLRVHWLSDVLAGALLGAGLAVAWPALLHDRRDGRVRAGAGDRTRFPERR